MPFIGVDNMRTVIEQLQYEVPIKDPRFAAMAIESVGAVPDLPPVRQVVYDLMLDVARDPDFQTISTRVKNEVVVDACIKYYGDLAKKMGLDQHRAPEQPRGNAPEKQTYSDDPSAPMPSGTRIVSPLSDGGGSAGGFGSSAAGLDAEAAFGMAGSGPVGVDHDASSRDVEKVHRCMSLDGQDRDVPRWTCRYHYSTEFDEVLKNIYRISVASVVVPLQDHTVNAPFLLLAFEEVSGLYAYNKSDAVRKAFTKLVPESSYASGHGRSYIVLKPAVDDAVEYDPPLPSLSRLTTQLLRPSGMLVSSSTDDLRVKKITQSSDGNWILTFGSFWPTKEFGKGDLCRLTGCSTGVDAVDQHINRHEGHEVLELGAPFSNEGCNKIVIRFAGRMDPSSGNFEPDPRCERAFDGSHEASEAVGEIAVDCQAMNLSLQMSITAFVTCEKPKA